MPIYGNMVGGFGHSGGGVNGDLNFVVVGGTTQPTNPVENTIWINTDTDITGWNFSNTDPLKCNLLNGLSLGDGYIQSDGNIHEQTAANPEVYALSYIPVSKNNTYYCKVTCSASNALWLAFMEYDANKNPLTRPIAINVTAAEYETTYTPINTNAAYVRATWRTFPSATTEVVFRQNINNGTVWIQTSDSSTATFNAAKENILMAYPVYSKQYSSGYWEDKSGYLWYGGEWMQFGVPRLYIIEDGYIDFNKYTYTYKYEAWNSISSSFQTYTGGVVDTAVKINQMYGDKPAVWFAGRNGSWHNHHLANVTVPPYATNLYIEYYLMCAYNNDPYFMLGDAKVTVSRGSSNKIENGVASIDVTALRDQTLVFQFSNYGQAYNEDNYIGSVWFE